MTSKSDNGASSPDANSSSHSGSKGHFDTFETDFFQQGDAESAGLPSEAERFDDLDGGGKHKPLAPSRKFMIRVAIGSVGIAIIGCAGIWFSSRHASASTSRLAEQPPAQVEPSQPATAPVAAPTPTAPVLAEAQVVPATAPAAPAAEAVIAQPAPAVAAEPAPTAVVPAPAEAPVAAEAQPAVAASSPQAAGETDPQIRCSKAISAKHNKDILAVCPDAFAANPREAGIATTLARIEFDRGRGVQALAWGNKAIAADPNAAEAYVFIGGAEQSSGHRKAAKDAYKRYLQLAPGGRYASDLRAIVGSL